MKRYIGILAVILGITVLFSACFGKNEGGEQTSDGTNFISDTSAANPEISYRISLKRKEL